MCRKVPAIAADCVVFDAHDRLLLIRRRRPPFEGQFALPGGFVEYGEEIEAAASRELSEETGLRARQLRLVGVYSRPDRDPRGHTISVAYLIAADAQAPRAGDDAASAEFCANWRDLQLAFDHSQIAADAAQLRGR
jgi:8-oxo-dGTP diphosphatase